jgi:hypothetical protein
MLIASVFEEIQKIDVFDLRSKTTPEHCTNTPAHRPDVPDVMAHQKNQKVSSFVWNSKCTSRMLIASIFKEIQKIDIFDLRSKKSKCSQSHSNYMCTNENVIALLPVEAQCCIH